MVSCCVFRCNNRSGRDKVSFHRFPSDPELKNLWIKALNRKNWTPSSTAKICSDHFLSSDLNTTFHSGVVRLRDGVIPSVFPSSPKHTHETSDEMKIPIKRSPSTEFLNASVPNSTTLPNYQQETSYGMNVPIKRSPSTELLDTTGSIPNYMPVTPCEINIPIKREPSTELLDVTGPIPTTFPNYMPCVIQLPIKREPIELLDTTVPLPMTAPTYLQETTYEMKIPIKREPSAELLDATEPLPLRVSTPFSLSLGVSTPSSQMPATPAEDVTLVKKMMTLELRQKTLTINKQTKKIKTLFQNIRRLKKRLEKLKAMSREIKQKKKIINNYHNMLNNMPPLAKELCTRLGKSSKIKYSPKLRSFASTLHFISPKAYNYVRESFLTTLPHPRTLTKWYEAVDAGISAEAVNSSTETESVDPSSAVNEDLAAEAFEPSAAIEVVYDCTTVGGEAGTARGN
ncbi:uncharacterized protein [Halyomorpha halys]|uniref:uncharacterized protein n=1 Tax=Halyomorpha halys TaxID=286706 RepID=UPI0006D4D93D|nr:uncharacterized protein LOC106678552 [Halyomorpha halys]